MQIKSLRYFMELAQAGSFYKAAKTLHISQQGLSKSIASLEEELGLSLVERNQRGIRLTRDGEMVLGHVRSIVSEHDSMVAQVYATRRVEGAPDERVVVHVSYYSAQIAAFDPEYIKKLADSTAYIEEPFEKLLHRAAASDGTDLVYMDVHPYSESKIKNDPNLIFDSTLTIRYGIVWKDGSSLADHEFIHREDVAELPMTVNASREISQLIEWLFEDYPKLDIRLGTTSPQLALDYIRLSNDGTVGVFDSFSFYLAKKFFPGTTEGLHFTPFATPKSVCEVGFLYPRNVKISMRAWNTVKHFKNFISRTCPDYISKYH